VLAASVKCGALRDLISIAAATYFHQPARCTFILDHVNQEGVLRMVFNRKSDSVPQQMPHDLMRPVEPPRTQHGGFANAYQQQPVIEAPVLESVIGNDLSIEGETITIRCKGSLKILGNIQADLHSKRLEVGKEAVIHGAIAADTVNVFGRVQGAILGAKVILHAGADVEGDIVSQLLSVEEGANFDGRSRRVTNPAEIAPQLERPSAAIASALLTSPQPVQAAFPRPVSQQSSGMPSPLN
jgi:cytoskeletal protein CcmA (bactofilin family)